VSGVAVWIGFNALDFVLIYINAFGVDSNAKLCGSYLPF